MLVELPDAHSLVGMLIGDILASANKHLLACADACYSNTGQINMNTS
ncbi:hypothetical protein N9I26_02615 [Pseudomonadales bacterium]|nr:hypothetical protein [Pseudomonadales bacterium]